MDALLACYIFFNILIIFKAAVAIRNAKYANKIGATYFRYLISQGALARMSEKVSLSLFFMSIEITAVLKNSHIRNKVIKERSSTLVIVLVHDVFIIFESGFAIIGRH